MVFLADKKVFRDRRCSGRDPNRTPTEYYSEPLSLYQQKIHRDSRDDLTRLSSVTLAGARQINFTSPVFNFARSCSSMHLCTKLLSVLDAEERRFSIYYRGKVPRTTSNVTIDNRHAVRKNTGTMVGIHECFSDH